MNPDKKQSVVGKQVERPISNDVYPLIDTDLARDNVENDLPYSDAEDLSRIKDKSKSNEKKV